MLFTLKNKAGKKEESKSFLYTERNFSSFLHCLEDKETSWPQTSYRAMAAAGYKRNPIAHRCIRLVSESAASVGAIVSEKKDVMQEHQVAALLQMPNPYQDGISFFQALYSHLLLAGNVYIQALIHAGKIQELHLLRPDRITIKTDASGQVSAYEYCVNSGRKRIIPYEDTFPVLLHIRGFDPLSDHFGISGMEAAMLAIETHNAASRWNKSLLDNAARPSGAIVNRKAENFENLTDKQYMRLKNDLYLMYQGARNAGRPLLLDGGLEWQNMSLSPTDMDYHNTKNTAAREIALALGVPPLMLGLPGDNTYANYKEANLAFWKQTILPYVQRVYLGLTNWFRHFYTDVKISIDKSDIDALISEQEARKKLAASVDFLTKNEKRAIFGYAPLDKDA